jgi:hypothetical protein
LEKFKAKRYANIPLEGLGKVGTGWWNGFIRRHGHRLVTKRGERFATDRANWSKKSYISQMYDVIYDNMVEAHIAIRLPRPISMDEEGNVIDDNNTCNAFGLPCDIEILHPDYVLFADETGCNTNQKKDGHYGGRKYVVERGTVPKEISSTRDRHFTVMGFTSASGLPVLCVVIFASPRCKLEAGWAEGMDAFVRLVRNEQDEILLDTINFGEGKFFPGGPTCHFCGKVIPYLPLVSPSGGITAELLVQILQYLDDLNVYERTDNTPCPMLVFDGHESHLDPIFLGYINEKRHKLFVSLGVPYATSYWQVGDSEQ